MINNNERSFNMNTVITTNEKLSEALKLLEDAAKEKKNELQNMIQGKYSHLKEALIDKEEDIAHALLAAKKQALKAAVHASEIGTERAKEIAAEVDQQVRENPWPYIGGVALGSLLIGYILGRSK
jgi:ElaB/YqjD/DUF883 family membrane-anchored ribosome-binding protein